MRQSKYSKRRPKNSLPYYATPEQMGKQHKVTLHHQNMYSSDKPQVTTKKNLPAIDVYDLGVFVDDMREMHQIHNLPEAKSWKVVRDIVAFSELLDDIPADVKSMCVSFDHYMYDTGDPRAMRKPDGMDCLYELSINHPKGVRIDIGGHSSDSVQNDRKMAFWLEHHSDIGGVFYPHNPR